MKTFTKKPVPPASGPAVGDIVESRALPSGALAMVVGENRLVMHVNGCGCWMGSDGRVAMEFAPYWPWGDGVGANVKILALGLTGSETKEHLQRLVDAAG